MRGARPLQLAEHTDPSAPVDVCVVGREVREDRETALLDEVAGEEDGRVLDEHDLVALRMRGADLPKVRCRDRRGRCVVEPSYVSSRLDTISTPSSAAATSGPNVRNIST